MAFLSECEVHNLGLQYTGKNVKISSRASIYNAGNILIHDNARIDDFCILSAGEGGIEIGRYVHIGCYSSLIGKGKITLKDFSGLSGRVSIYSSNDDFSGTFMSHPTIPERYRNVTVGEVILEPHVIIGAGSVILPGVHIQHGAAIGAMSLVKQSCGPFEIYGGIPAKFIRHRKKDLLNLEKELRQDTRCQDL